MTENWFDDLFIEEAKKALLNRNSYGSSGSGPDDNTIILVDENGVELVAVKTDEEVDLTATTNDIRAGTVAVTDDGVVTGTKEIPGYHTTEGTIVVKPGNALTIPYYSDECQYDKLQVIVCDYNTSVDDSVNTKMVVINNKVYDTSNMNELATVTVDLETQSIDLGLINTTDNSLVIRYMSIKEEE